MYSLASKPSLQKVMEDVGDRVKSKKLLGLVFVHPSDSTVLWDSFWDVDDNPSLFLCVVSHRDGQIFLDWIQEQEPGDVSVRVDLESSVDVPSVTVKGPSSADTAEADRGEPVPVCVCVYVCMYTCICVCHCVCVCIPYLSE